MNDVTIHDNISLSEYLGWRAFSQSSLKMAKTSLLHVYSALTEPKKITDDMRLGSALHTAFWEPDRREDRVVEYTGKKRDNRVQEWRDFQEEHAGKVILTPGYFNKMVRMTDAARAHRFTKRWVSMIERVEVSVKGTLNGLPVKGRIDGLTASNSDPIVDLKKVTAVDDRTIRSTIMAFGYHIQGALYRRLMNRERFVLLCVEGSPPFDVVPYELTDKFLKLGDEALDWIIPSVKHCLKAGEWPGSSPDVDPIPVDPPTWAIDEATITLNGASM